jgi:hypothetical protein
MYICDSGGFFQTTFLVAINPAKWPKGQAIVSDDTFAKIREGKERRSSAILDDDMRYYNWLENATMIDLMNAVDEGIRRIGVALPPSKWFSPAQVAQAWMTNRVPDRETIEAVVPEAFRKAARASFIAGWFETFMHGPIPGIVYQYDINSAYPYHANRLPCLLHGEWSEGTGKPDDPGPYCLIKAEVTVPIGQKKRHIGSMLHRTEKGRICRPAFTAGWYWNHELQAAIRAGCVRVIKYHEWQRYRPCACPSPLRELKDLYELRITPIENKNSPLGRGARLVYNCVYGKLCQNVGIPKFMNFVYASLITAGCRTQILDAIATHPMGKAGVVQVATDAVYFLTPHPSLPQSIELGDWEAEEHHNLTVFKPGVYWDDKARASIAAGQSPQFKARGVSARDMAAHLDDLDSQYAAWNGKPPKVRNGMVPNKRGWPHVEFMPSFQMISAKQAMVWNKWELAGTLKNEPVTQSGNPADKRDGVYYDAEWGVYRTEPIRLWPVEGRFGWSQPYDERFDQSQETNPMADDNRDKWGITPDGMVDMLMIDAMMPDRKNMPDVSTKKTYISRPGRARMGVRSMGHVNRKSMENRS